MKHREMDDKDLGRFFSTLKEQDAARFGLPQERSALQEEGMMRPSAKGRAGTSLSSTKPVFRKLWHWAAAAAAVLLLGFGVNGWLSFPEEPRERAERGVSGEAYREAVGLPASELDLFSVGLDEEGQLAIEIWQYANYEIWQADSDILLYD